MDLLGCTAEVFNNKAVTDTAWFRKELLSLWGHCPHCCPYLGAAPVAEPVRAVRSHQQAHGGSGPGPARLTSYKACACYNTELDGGGVTLA